MRRFRDIFETQMKRRNVIFLKPFIFGILFYVQGEMKQVIFSVFCILLSLTKRVIS